MEVFMPKKYFVSHFSLSKQTDIAHLRWSADTYTTELS